MIINGLLPGLRYCPSPNADDRPDAADINLLVIHNISLPPGVYESGCVEALFTNTLDCSTHTYFEQLTGLRVSAHLLIERSGNCIQFVPFNRRAWHAGVSEYCGRPACNDYSIGIELEGTDDEAYTEAQYTELASITMQLMAEYPGLTRERIVGHSDIAPGRKTDPGAAFDWNRYRDDMTNGAKL